MKLPFHSIPPMDVLINKPRVIYVAGPMTGIPEFNYPEFHERAAELRAKGFTVLNPAETDDDTSKPRSYFMRRAIYLLCHAEAIVVLPGWESSDGTRKELMLAQEFDMPVYDIQTMTRLDLSGVDLP